MRRSLLVRLVVAAALLLAPWGAFAQDIPFDFRALERQLHLDRAQKAQFDDAVAATRRAMLVTALVGMEMKDRIAHELARQRPDLRRLLPDPDAVRADLEPNWREAHAAWARFYATLDERQVAIAREYVERRLARLQDFAGGLLERFGEELPRP
jgi:hypothetical protein